MSLRLFFSKPSLVRQRGSQGLSGMSNLYLSTLRIIFNDEQLVAVDKPPGMLSVPGREKRKEVTSLTRSQEWSVVVSTLLAHLKRENSLSPLVAILHVLNEQRGRVPRQDQKFIRYAQRIMKNQCSKEDAQQLWLRLSSLDRSMYGTLPEEFPAELISASDIMEKQFNQRLFHLHRLDQETSGVLMFGKDSKSANYICNQFREHQVSLTLTEK
jgi:23S rRNA-/tRNA-specific pseudouridylate synthase